MKWSVFLLLSFLTIGSTMAQQENIWVLGGSGLDFNTTPPSIIHMSAKIFDESGASVCDNNGQLLFYTDGDSVWNRNYNMMPDGFGLSKGIGTFSTTQGVLIIPVPDEGDQYYIFSLTSLENGADGGKLFYSKVDMRLNSGMGAVVPNQKSILLDSNLTEKLTGITGDRCNIWVICRSRFANTFKSYEVTASGVNVIPVISHTGSMSYFYYTIGGLTPAPDGHKILSANASGSKGGLEVYDFDPVTGLLSNPVALDSTDLYYSASFSPDQSKVYALTHYIDTKIYQFDLNASHPSDTKTLLGPAPAFDKLKLAPDGKIYFSNRDALGSIKFPNLAGTACGFNGNAIVFSNNITKALPNVMPVFRQDTAAFTSTSISAPCWGVGLSLSLQSPENGWDYLWNDRIAGPELPADTPGLYWVTYHTSPCRYHSDTFHVSFPNGVLPHITVDTACVSTANGNAYASTYPGDTVTYHYSWQNQQGDTLSLTDTLQHVPSGNYTLLVTTAHCDTTLSFYIPEVDYQVSFQADSIICQGTELQFTNTSDSSFTQFFWDFGDYHVSGLRSPAHMYEHSGRYRVILIGKGKICMDTANKTIAVDSQFVGSFIAAPDSICAGETIAFYPTAKDSSITGLHWQFGDETEMTSDRIDNKIQHAYETAGTMPVTLTAQFRACRDTAYTDIIHVYPLPKVYLGHDSGLCLHGTPITLKNLQGTSTGVHHYLWNTGDTMEVLKVVHPGRYSLTVSNEPLGCSTTETIKITKDCYIDIPNAFAPNGDGHNDYFFPRQLLSQKIKQFKVQIFNRWGELIFETTNINGRGWDGKFNGKNQPEGIYVYLIDADFANGRKEHYEGNVTLLR